MTLANLLIHLPNLKSLTLGFVPRKYIYGPNYKERESISPFQYIFWEFKHIPNLLELIVENSHLYFNSFGDIKIFCNNLKYLPRLRVLCLSNYSYVYYY